MKKILSLLVVAGATVSLSACGSVPTCNESLDNCDRSGPYTEERTIPTGKRVAAPVPAPAPVAMPVKVNVPEPILLPKAEMPAPVVVQQPAPMIVDTHVMQSAEPAFRQISK